MHPLLRPGSEEGIHTNLSKTQTVSNWPTRQNLGDIRSFIGCAVPDFATLAKHLVGLTEKNTAFRWTDMEEQAFSTLKKKLIMAPILAYPDLKRPFILNTNASNMGIGAVLSKDFDREERVIAYGSRMLSKGIKALLHHPTGAVGRGSLQQALQALPVRDEIPAPDGQGCVEVAEAASWSQRENSPGGWRPWSHSTTTCDTDPN